MPTTPGRGLTWRRRVSWRRASASHGNPNSPCSAPSRRRRGPWRPTRGCPMPGPRWGHPARAASIRRGRRVGAASDRSRPERRRDPCGVGADDARDRRVGTGRPAEPQGDPADLATSSWYYVPQTFGLVYLGRFDEAAAAGERMSELAESPFMRSAARLGIVFADVEAGRIDAARAIVGELKPLSTDQGADRAAAGFLFKDARDAERLSRALVRAGVPL